MFFGSFKFAVHICAHNMTITFVARANANINTRSSSFVLMFLYWKVKCSRVPHQIRTKCGCEVVLVLLVIPPVVCSLDFGRTTCHTIL